MRLLMQLVCVCWISTCSGVVIQGLDQFIEALTDVSVTTITIADGTLLLPDQGGPYAIDRNLIIEGSVNTNKLDTTRNVGFLVLEGNRTLTLRNLVISYRTTFVSDIDINFLKLSNDTTLRFSHTTTRSLVCFPRSNTTTPRSKRYPGTQISVLLPTYCDDEGCWTNTLRITNTVADISYDRNVTVFADNNIATCKYFVDRACLETQTRYTCLFQRLANALSVATFTTSGLPPWAIAVIILSSVIILASFLAYMFFRFRKGKKTKTGSDTRQIIESQNPTDETMITNSGRNSLQISVSADLDGMPSGLQLGLLLGAGAFGRVYKGYYYGKMVAIKVMDKGGEVELRFAKNMDHRNIVHIIDTFASSPLRPAVVIMEYCACGPLSRQFGKLSLHSVLSLLIDVAEGMRYLQWHHVVHGDLKAENILLIEDHEVDCGLVAKVSDFGLSRVLSVDETFYQTLSLGTITHLSPSVMKTGRFTHMSDVYAFGVLMLELVTTGRIWGNMHPLQIMEAVSQGQRPQFPAGILRAYEALAKECWAQDALTRPSFAEIITKLHDVYNSLTKPQTL